MNSSETEASGRDSKFLVPSLHDVAPATWKSCKRVLEQLPRLGIRRCSLLVVPDYHKQGILSDNPPFCEWLRELQAEGHEIVLHGYHHLAQPGTAKTLRERYFTGFYTSGENEFHQLSRVEAKVLIKRGKAALEREQLSARGFIAPAWLLSPGAQEALAEEDFTYTVLLQKVVNLKNGRRHSSQSLVWSVRAMWRRQMSLLWNWLLFDQVQENELVRISLHPADERHRQVWRQIRSFLKESAATRTVTTYGDWVEDHLS